MKKWNIVVRTREDVTPQEMMEALDGWDVIYVEEITEEVDGDSKCIILYDEYDVESKGRLARMDGHPITTNPYNHASQSLLFKSWNAGWCDIDMDQNAPKEPIVR